MHKRFVVTHVNRRNRLFSDAEIHSRMAEAAMITPSDETNVPEFSVTQKIDEPPNKVVDQSPEKPDLFAIAEGNPTQAARLIRNRLCRSRDCHNREILENYAVAFAAALTLRSQLDKWIEFTELDSGKSSRAINLARINPRNS